MPFLLPDRLLQRRNGLDLLFYPRVAEASLLSAKSAHHQHNY